MQCGMATTKACCYVFQGKIRIRLCLWSHFLSYVRTTFFYLKGHTPIRHELFNLRFEMGFYKLIWFAFNQMKKKKKKLIVTEIADMLGTRAIFVRRKRWRSSIWILLLVVHKLNFRQLEDFITIKYESQFKILR